MSSNRVITNNYVIIVNLHAYVHTQNIRGYSYTYIYI